MKLLVIEVTDEVYPGGDKTDYGIRKTRQVAYLHGMSAYPDKWEMRYEHTVRPIEPGKYLLGAGSFRIGKYGPEVNTPDLIPLEAAGKAIEAMLQQKAAPRVAA